MHENDRVADDHADEGHNTNEGDEANGIACEPQGENDADEAEGRHADDEAEMHEVLQLDHEHGQHEKAHHGQDGDNRGRGFVAFLHGTSDCDAVARRHGLFQLLHFSHESQRNGFRHFTAYGLSLDRDCRLTVAAPDQGIILGVRHIGEYAQGDGTAVRQLYV